MHLPLSDNPAHLQQLCQRLALGSPGAKPRQVHGGFHHRMWRVETERGTWAIKQLAPDTDLADPTIVTHFNRGEHAAALFSKAGIGSIHALDCEGAYLQLLDDDAYLVFPWTEYHALEGAAVSREHALAVARLLARMHRCDLQLEGAQFDDSPPVSEGKLLDMVALAAERQVEIAPALLEHLPTLQKIARLHKAAAPLLARRTVLSHGDLDQKNVLWDGAGQPLLIDWESARLINPTFEAVLEALDWSGITGEFDSRLYREFIQAYRDDGGLFDELTVNPALQCILGDWLDWLLYNIGRIIMLDDPDQRSIGRQQAEFILPVILTLEELLPALNAMLHEPAEQATRNGL